MAGHSRQSNRHDGGDRGSGNQKDDHWQDGIGVLVVHRVQQGPGQG